MNADMLTPELLRRLYSDQQLSTTQIGARVGCGNVTVLKRLRKFGICVRSRAEGVRLNPARKPAVRRLSHHDQVMLKDMAEYGEITERETRRLHILLALDRGEHPRAIAAAEKVSKMVIYYLWQQYRQRGWAAIFHGNTNKIRVNGEWL